MKIFNSFLIGVLATFSIYANTANAQITAEQHDANQKTADKLSEIRKHIEDSKHDPSLDIKYVTGINEKPDNWHFIYGPVGKNVTAKTARLYAVARNGFAMFSCNSSGHEEFLMSMASVYGPDNSEVKMEVNIAGNDHLLPLQIVGQHGYHQSLFYATDANVAGMLDILGVSPDNLPQGFTVSYDKKIMTIPSPNPSTGAQTMRMMCYYWYNKHLVDIGAISPPKPVEQTPASSLSKPQ